MLQVFDLWRSDPDQTFWQISWHSSQKPLCFKHTFVMLLLTSACNYREKQISRAWHHAYMQTPFHCPLVPNVNPCKLTAWTIKDDFRNVKTGEHLQRSKATFSPALLFVSILKSRQWSQYSAYSYKHYTNEVHMGLLGGIVLFSSTPAWNNSHSSPKYFF